GGATEVFNLNLVAIELQHPIQVAQAARKIVVADRRILHFQTALQHGIGKRAAGGEVYTQRAARQNFRIERLKERHIDGAVQAEVELLRARQMHATMRGEIGPTPRQVEALNQHSLIREFQSNGTNIFYRYVLNLNAEGLQFGGGFQFPRISQGPAYVQRSPQRTLSRDLALQVNAQQRIDVEMMEGEIQVGGKVVLVVQPNAAGNGQIGFIEIGVSVEIELASMGDRIDVEIAGPLLVERQVFEVNVRFERGLFDGAADSHREIRDAIGREPVTLQPRKTGEI